MIIDFFENVDTSLQAVEDTVYRLTIKNAIFNSYKNELTLICELTNERNNSFLIKETLVIGSKNYCQAMRALYAGDDGDIIAVDTDDLTNYSGDVRLKFKGDKVMVDWSTASSIQSLLSEFWGFYHPEINDIF